MDILLQNPLYILGGFVCLGLFLYCITRARRMPYFACDTLLTKSELRFYSTLRHATPPNTLIMMKVRMADIINCIDRDWSRGWGPKISAKHIDFVLIDNDNTAIKLAIELDDSTHRTVKNRIDRDKFVNKAFEAANIPLLRIQVQREYKASTLKSLISQSID